MAQESWKREKDETDCKIPEGLILCINNCGLFGSPATLNMCSKCYADSLLMKPNSPPPSSSSPPPHRSSSSPPPHTSASSSPSQARFCSSSSPSSFSLPSTSAADALEKSPQKICSSVLRCSSCRKKVGLTGFRCRCGDLFCPQHRYSDKHDCTYDYKAAGREAIARENPVVKAAKIIKI